MTLVQQWPTLYGAKNTFGMSVYSKQYTLAISLIYTISISPVSSNTFYILTITQKNCLQSFVVWWINYVTELDNEDRDCTYNM
jgi:hypothetical protein